MFQCSLSNTESVISITRAQNDSAAYVDRAKYVWKNFYSLQVSHDKNRERVMRKWLLSSVALLALGATAQAADLPRKAPAVSRAPIMNTWTGFYVGGHIGGAWRDDGNMIGGTGGGSDARFMGGGQVGFDYQFWNSWVVGFEANYSFLDRNNGGTTFPGGFTFNDQTRGLFSATGRLGYTWGQALLYAKGGYAHRDARDTFTGPAGAVAFTTTNNSRNGYTLGGGVEYMFLPNWSAKVEYQYYQFDRTTFTAPAVLVASGGFRDEEHTVKLGINYRFNMLNPMML
jgi:outer membrane immunogenic protein